MAAYLIRKQLVALATLLSLLRLPCDVLVAGSVQSHAALSATHAAAGRASGQLGGPLSEPCPPLPGASWGL